MPALLVPAVLREAGPVAGVALRGEGAVYGNMLTCQVLWNCRHVFGDSLGVVGNFVGCFLLS